MIKTKIFLINIIIAFLFVFLLKYFSLLILLSSEFKGIDLFKEVNQIMKFETWENIYKKVEYRPVENENSERNPIVILGCSFANGESSQPLNDNQTISYLLSRELKEKRPIYNRAIGSQGIQAMIWQFTSQQIYKIIKKEPELIIYILINDTTRRLYMECCPWNKSAFYKEGKNNSIKLISNPLYYSYFMALLREIFFEQNIYNGKISDNQKFDFLRKHFIYLKNEASKKWKNTKWLIIYYHDEFINEEIKLLEKDGFGILFVSEIAPKDFIENTKYRISETDRHPSKYAWEVIVPRLYEKISKKYNIK